MDEYVFLGIALSVSLLTGGICAYLGNFILMKNMTFISIALAQVSALGVALGAVLSLNVHLTSFVTTLLAVIIFWKYQHLQRRTGQGSIGVIYAACSALTVILMATHPMVQAHGLDLVNGNLLYCTLEDLFFECCVFTVIAIVHVLFRKEFIFIAFDEETAGAFGMKATRWDLLLMVTIGIVISVSMSHAGVLFVFASLIIPAMTALAAFKRISLVFLFSVLISIGCVISGGAVSYFMDLPTSSSIIMAMSIVYGLTVIVKHVVLKNVYKRIN